MRLGIDVDGVLADFNKDYQELYIKATGKNLWPYLPYDPPCWDYARVVGYTKDDDTLVWDAIKEDAKFWECLPRYADTKSILKQLSDLEDQGHEVYFITTRVGISPKRQTTKWLMKNGMETIPSVIVSGNKGPVAEGIGLDCFIDDKPENCEAVLKARGTHCRVYLLDRTWNQEFQNKYITRVWSMDQFFAEEGIF